MSRHLLQPGLVLLLVLAGGCAEQLSNSQQDPPIPTHVRTAGQVPSKACPEEFRVKFETTKGNILVEVHRKWSPYGADRFYDLINDHFYDGCRFFRVLPTFVVQFGINGDPQVTEKWKQKNIPDDHFDKGDKNRQSNKRGYLTYAKGGKNSRTTQIFFNCVDNGRLDAMGFTPFAKVIEGMEVVDSFYSEYGEEPQESAPRIEGEGNAYLQAAFPRLDSIKKATLVTGKGDAKPAAK